MDPRPGERGLIRPHALGAQADDESGQHVPGAGAGEGGGRKRQDGDPSIRRGDDGERAFQHDHMSPLFRELAGDGFAVGLDLVFRESRQHRHFARVRGQHCRRGEFCLPAGDLREEFQPVGVYNQRRHLRCFQQFGEEVFGGFFEAEAGTDEQGSGAAEILRDGKRARAGDESVFVREGNPRHFGEVSRERGIQGFGERQRDEARADAVGGLGREICRAGVTDRSRDNERGAKRAFVRVGGTRRQDGRDPPRVRNGAGDFRPRGQVVGQADVRHFEFAHQVEGGQAEQSLLDGGHGHGEIGGEAFVRGRAGVAVHARGTVHGEDERRVIEGVERTARDRKHTCHLRLERKFDAGAEQAIEEDVRAFDESGERDKFIVFLCGDDLTARLEEALGEFVGFAFDAVGAGTPACAGKMRKGNECIAAVVSRTDESKNLFPAFVTNEIVYHFGQAAAGVFHHLRIRESAGIGLLFDGFHFRDGDEFHGRESNW